MFDGAPVLLVVRDALADVLSTLPDEKRKGGYFCLYDRWSPHTPLLISLVGTVSDYEKTAKYFALAQEKTLRLHSRHPHHRSSWQSRNPEKNMWGGSIAADQFYLSFSGLPELADEAVVLLSALRLDLLKSKYEALELAQLSQNSIFLNKMWWVNGKLLVMSSA